MTLVQIAKDGPTGSIRKMRGVDILPVEDEREGFLVTSGSRPFRIRIRERNVY
jgi:hypothetical protein